MAMVDSYYVLDCEGLSRAVLGERAMSARLKDARRAPDGYHGGDQLHELDRGLSQSQQDPTPGMGLADVSYRGRARNEGSRRCGDRTARRHGAALHGHKYAIDAALAVIAGAQSGDVVLYTSDQDDMSRLCHPRVRVRPL